MSDRKYEYDLTDYGDEEDYEEYARQQDKLRGYDRQKKKGSQKTAAGPSGGGKNRVGQKSFRQRQSPSKADLQAQAGRGPVPRKRSHPVWFLLAVLV